MAPYVLCVLEFLLVGIRAAPSHQTTIVNTPRITRITPFAAANGVSPTSQHTGSAAPRYISARSRVFLLPERARPSPTEKKYTRRRPFSRADGRVLLRPAPLVSLCPQCGGPRLLVLALIGAEGWSTLTRRSRRTLHRGWPSPSRWRRRSPPRSSWACRTPPWPSRRPPWPRSSPSRPRP